MTTALGPKDEDRLDGPEFAEVVKETFNRDDIEFEPFSHDEAVEALVHCHGEYCNLEEGQTEDEVKTTCAALVPELAATGDDGDGPATPDTPKATTIAAGVGYSLTARSAAPERAVFVWATTRPGAV